MSQSKLSLNNFLEEENSNSSAVLVIIELDEQNKDNVTVSLWNKNDCNCNGKFSIAKTLIESVEKTNESHFCCGKTHTVVKINFVKDASIKMDDLLTQMASNNKVGGNLMHHTSQQFNVNEVKPDIINNNIDFTVPQHSIRPGFETCRKMTFSKKCSNGGFKLYETYIDILTNRQCGPTVLVADHCIRFQDRNGQRGSYHYYHSGNDIA